MSPSRLAPFRMSLLCSVFFLGGCAAMEPQQENTAWLIPDTYVTLAELDEQTGHLEQRFTQICGLDEARGQAQLAAINTSLDVLHRVHSEVRALNHSRTVTRDCPPPSEDRIGGKEILGEVEWVGLPSLGTALEARVDTGAESSSLTAHNISRFERDGENWVRFQIALNDEDTVADHLHDLWLEAPVVRTARIIQAAGTENRPVIRLPMELGNIEQTVEFTLSDRTQLTYPVLLGRRFMIDIAVVDVSHSYRNPRPNYPAEAAIAARDQDNAILDESDESKDEGDKDASKDDTSNSGDTNSATSNGAEDGED